MKTFFRSERGTSLIEFGLTAPMLAFFLIGLVETGRYARFAIMAASAARAGVQYGAQNLTTAVDNAGMIGAARQDAQNLSGFTVTAKHFCSNNGGALQLCVASGAPPSPTTVYYVQVQVSGTFNSLVNYPGLPSSLPVAGSAIMRVSNQ